MLRGIAKPCNGGQMVGGGISLMSVETIARVILVQILHEPIPRHLGHDRGRSDGCRAAIAANHPALGHRQ